MEIRKRTGEEIRAYVDGYNACFKEFEKQAEKDNYLDKAIYKVGKLRRAVNSILEIKENEQVDDGK